jgi:hypothetical protein
LNRNFLLSGRSFAGAPEAYRELDPLLNPPTPPTLLEPFLDQGRPRESSGSASRR